MKSNLDYIPWRLSELSEPPINAPTVLSTFSCGGGSSMGYKLAGFKLIGCVEMDPKMLNIYKKNLNPPKFWNMPIQEFNKIPNIEIPTEFFELDILDGSPPCSVFSMAGSREKKWGSAHAFREGQAIQRLDDLFFHFINTAAKLRPKFVVAENVKGMLMGNARGYLKEIFEAFEQVGYIPQLFLLNSSRMSVPQRRERVFFLARRSDLKIQDIQLSFDCPNINILSASKGIKTTVGKMLTPGIANWWKKTQLGKSIASVHPKKSLFSYVKVDPKRSAPTVTSQCCMMHWDSPNSLSLELIKRLQTFPEDYDFGDQKVEYICGMSVPPYMMRAVANEIKKQWIEK